MILVMFKKLVCKIRIKKAVRKMKKLFIRSANYNIREVYHDAESCSYLFLCKDDNGHHDSVRIDYPKEASLAMWECVMNVSAIMGFVMK